jgi:hypothetical protein
MNHCLRPDPFQNLKDTITVANIGFEKCRGADLPDFCQIRSLVTGRVKIVEVVDDRNLKARLQEAFGYMRTDESRASGH